MLRPNFSVRSDQRCLRGNSSVRSTHSLLWYMLVLEVPRYFLGAIVIGFAGQRRPLPPILHVNPTISLLLVGHNEAHRPASLRASLLASSR